MITVKVIPKEVQKTLASDGLENSQKIKVQVEKDPKIKILYLIS